MPPEILTALRQIRQTMGDDILHDERRVSAFLADLLGNRHPGERRLLLLLLAESIPRMIQSGQLKEADIAAKAHHLSQSYFLDKDKLVQGIGVWYAVVLGVPVPKPPPRPKPQPAPPPPPKPQPAQPAASGPQPGPAPTPRPRPAATPKSGGGLTALVAIVLVFVGIGLLVNNNSRNRQSGIRQGTDGAPGARSGQTRHGTRCLPPAPMTPRARNPAPRRPPTQPRTSNTPLSRASRP